MPEKILSIAFKQSTANLGQPFVADVEIRHQIEYVVNNLKNRAGVRLLMACLLAKMHKPEIDIRKPYTAAEKNLGERVLALHSHNAADIQTGALGDIEITLINDDKIITCYEMKDKRVNNEDIDRAFQKILALNTKVDNYIFITTERIETSTQEYARTFYNLTGGMEFVILDCIGFIRHFLHLFHRVRINFLEIYQEQILKEPESSINQPVKEAFLAMRQTAETEMEND